MILTTSNGNPVEDNQTSQTAGAGGPVLLQDFHLIDKLSHFDRERIPERVVHAKGAGAYGYFEVTNDITKYTKAKLFNKIGKRTPVLLRFSTVGGEKGSADTERDPRGFAVKFYTEEGNWDMVGNNTPVFFIRDPLKFPDFIHTQKRNPQTNLKDPDMTWDFLSLVPESLHQVTILYSDRGTPEGFRFMNGYSSHTFKLINAKNEVFFCKFHFKTDQGIKNLNREQAAELAGKDPDYATRDLFNAIAKGQFPNWNVNIQLMPVADAAKYRWNIFDVTKVWPHGDYPLIRIGKLVLNRNPQNYFAEIEQAAFSPSHMVPGIEASADRMLQGRLFSYPDTHRHRLGVNYTQIPANRPLNARVAHHQRDGFMCVDGNFGSAPNYEPNSVGGPKEVEGKPFAVTYTPDPVSGSIGRHTITHTKDDFVQPAKLYAIQTPEGQKRMVDNFASSLSGAKPHIVRRQMGHFKNADKKWSNRIQQEVMKFNGSKI